MITLPSTLGLFDRNIVEIAEMVHAHGALMYGDGANMNAMVGQVKPGDLGFDVMHINLHKTFSQPHGGGGPGAGPIVVKEHLIGFLPSPHVARRRKWAGRCGGDHLYASRWSIRRRALGGWVHLRHGQFGVLLRAYAYIRSLGPDGLRAMSEAAVLNANYVQARAARGVRSGARPHVHARGAVLRPAEGAGAKTLDIAKRMIDYGYHPPTIYFPLVVDEAMLIEPTESEIEGDAGRVLRRDAGDRCGGGGAAAAAARSTARRAAAPAG